MKRALYCAALCLLIHAAIAQPAATNPYAAIDKKAMLLPDSSSKTTTAIAAYMTSNFATAKDRSRAIFIWVANHIDYDIANMFAINFYEKEEDKINKPLATGKGICENYAAVFTDVCRKAGIQSYVVEGYTRQAGFTDYIPHAWCAALIDTAWYLFDPTWGSGYVSNGAFVRKINNAYYKASPATLIKSHMPFDYLWQFLNYPVTNQEFYEGKTAPDKTKPFFSFIDSIPAFEHEDHELQLSDEARRVEQNGVKNGMIYDRLHHLKAELEVDQQNAVVTLFNTAAADYNGAVNSLNEFISYRNQQFLPVKEDAAIQSMLDTVKTDMNEAKNKLAAIQNADANTTLLITQLNRSIADLAVHANEQQDWLTEYLSKPKAKRKSMFVERKITWFGIPVH